MPLRLSPTAVLALVVVAAATAWITWRAKALESDLDDDATRVALAGKAAPDFHLTALDGSTVSASDYAGKKKLVLVFCASWNIGSAPAVLSLNQFYKSTHKPESDYEIAAVMVDDDRADAKQFVERSRLAFPVLLASRSAATGTFGVRRLPTVMLVGTDGKVEYGLAGFNGRMLGDLAQHLGVSDFRMEMMGAPNGRRN